MKYYLFLFILFSSLSSKADAYLDSLWNIWNDSNMADTIKVEVLGLIAWNGYLFSNPDSAYYFSNQQFELAEKIKNKKWMAIALNNMGASRYMKSAFNEAIELYSRGLKLSEELGNMKKVAISYNNLANVYSDKGDYESAISSYEKSIALKEKLRDSTGLAKTLGNIGIIYYEQGNYAKAVECYIRSLKVKEEIGDLHGTAITYVNLGTVYQKQADYKDALKYFNLSKKIFTTMEDENGLGHILLNLGKVYLDLKQYDTALTFFQKSVEVNEKIKNLNAAAGALGNIGIIHQVHKEYDKAMLYFEKGLKLKKESEDQVGEAFMLNNMSKLLLEQNELQKSKILAESALKIGQKTGNVLQIKNAAMTLSECYKRLGQHQKALALYELSIEMKDSISNEENQREVLRQGFQYNYDKQLLADSLRFQAKQEIETLQHQGEMKEATRTKVLLITGMGFLFILGGMAFVGYRRKRRDNDIIKAQKEEVEIQREALDEKNQEITDSIQYARRIQEAILPPEPLVKKYLNRSFILYQPKDIVAGDFYWFEARGDEVYFAVADCTGHGVPGAMVSVVCANALNRVVKEMQLSDPGAILDKVRELVVQTFEKSEHEVKDGMDISFCKMNLKTKKVSFSGANNSMYRITKIDKHQGEKVIQNETHTLEDHKGDRQPIGKYADGKPFEQKDIQLQAGDTIYLFSDGYPDQFGGEKGKKFMHKRFKSLLLTIHQKEMEEQKHTLLGSFEAWKGNQEQVDDVCIIGVKV